MAILGNAHHFPRARRNVHTLSAPDGSRSCVTTCSELIFLVRILLANASAYIAHLRDYFKLFHCNRCGMDFRLNITSFTHQRKWISFDDHDARCLIWAHGRARTTSEWKSEPTEEYRIHCDGYASDTNVDCNLHPWFLKGNTFSNRVSFVQSIHVAIRCEPTNAKRQTQTTLFTIRNFYIRLCAQFIFPEK